MKKVILSFTISMLILSLTGCSLLPPMTMPTYTPVPSTIPPTQTMSPSATPITPTESPIRPTEMSTALPPTTPPSGYEPQPGDSLLKRDKVFLDVGNSSVVIRNSLPSQVSVLLNGNLSDPCHQLRVVVSPVNSENQINLDVYSVVDPHMACITVLKPFNVTILLGKYEGGHFTVYVNGQLIGQFDA